MQAAEWASHSARHLSVVNGLCKTAETEPWKNNRKSLMRAKYADQMVALSLSVCLDARGRKYVLTRTHTTHTSSHVVVVDDVSSKELKTATFTHEGSLVLSHIHSRLLCIILVVMMRSKELNFHDLSLTC